MMKLERTQDYVKSTSQNKGILFLMVLITLIAMFLRFKELTFQSYWYDELYSIATAIPEHSYKDILEGSFQSIHPPLFHSMLWGWFHLFGFTELSGRMFPALLGTLCIPVIYLLGKELFNKETGFYSAIFATFNIFLIRYSQETRPYSLLLLLSLLSMFFFVRTLKTGSRLNLVSFILSTTALLYTHYYGFLIIGVELLFLGIYISKKNNNRVRLLVFALITAIALIIAVIPIASSIIADAERSSFWIAPPRPDFMIHNFKLFFGSSSFAIILIVLLMIKGFINGTDSKPGITKTWGISLVILWFMVVFIVPYFKSIISLPTLIPRTTIIAIPAILYLASYGLSEVKHKSAKSVIVVALICIFSMNIFYELNYYGKVKKEEWRYVLINTVKQYPDIPIYSPKCGKEISAYSKMLGLNPRVQSLSELKLNLKGRTAEKCFILIERRYNKLDKILAKEKILDPKRFYLAENMKRKGVDALLFAAKGTPKSFCERKKRIPTE